MRIYMIRHPRPAVAAGVCYGRSDLALAEDAAACAQRLRPLLPAAATIHSSPLSRCRQLAECLHPAPRYDDRLMELNFGDWEMRAWDDIDRASLDAWVADPLSYVPPGGESAAAMIARVEEFMAEHETSPELVLVCHAGVMKAIISSLTGTPPLDWFSTQFDYAAVSLVEDGQLVWHNRVTL